MEEIRKEENIVNEIKRLEKELGAGEIDHTKDKETDMHIKKMLEKYRKDILSYRA